MEPILLLSSTTTKIVKQNHPFSNLQEIRTFITSLQGKRITLKKEQLWKTCLELLSFHPTWKEHLDNIEEIKIVKNKLNDSPCMKIKPTWCKRFILISWRKCVKKKISKKNILKETTNQTTTAVNSVIDLTLDSPVIISSNLSLSSPLNILDNDPIIDLTPYSPADIEKLDFEFFQSQSTPSPPPSTQHDKTKNIIDLTPILSNSNTTLNPLTNPTTNPLTNLTTNSTTNFTTPQLIKAMRYAIRRQIQKFRKTFTLLKCCVQCQKKTLLQVDHIYPFCFLVRDFLNKKLLSEIPTTFQYKRRTGLVFFNKTDQSFNRSWQIYHRKNATYQWLCKTCNISKSNKCK